MGHVLGSLSFWGLSLPYTIQQRIDWIANPESLSLDSSTLGTVPGYNAISSSG
jgi:hypothetical protein